MGSKRKRKKKRTLALIVLLVLIVIIVAVVIWFVKPDLYHKFLGVGNHTWGDWKTTPATCGRDGEEKRECSVCGETESKVISKTNNHSWGNWTTVAATCGTDGEEKRICSICEEEEINVLKATGRHTWGDWETFSATCVKDGEKKRSCSVCDEKDSVVLPATGIHNFNDKGICFACGYNSSDVSGSEVEIYTSDLSIHFLELGNKYTGDCTLIKCGNTEVLIDAGSRTNSASTICNYINKYCTDGVLEYVIATHAHQDHIAGFVGSNVKGATADRPPKSGVLYQYKIGTIIQFSGHKTSSVIYGNYCDAVTYAESKGATVYDALQCWEERDGAKKTYYLDGAQTVSMNILYNYYYDHPTVGSTNENDYSVCMLLTQKTQTSEKNFLFTGDLEERGESYLVDNNELPEVDLFKGGHHGSYTATTEKLLNAIKPKNVAVCCCCGTTEYMSNKDNTFPSQAFISRVCKYTENVYCTTLINDYEAGDYTPMNGNIVFYTVNGGKLKLWCSNNTVKLKDTDWFKENRVWA